MRRLALDGGWLQVDTAILDQIEVHTILNTIKTERFLNKMIYDINLHSVMVYKIK